MSERTHITNNRKHLLVCMETSITLAIVPLRPTVQHFFILGPTRFTGGR